MRHSFLLTRQTFAGTRTIIDNLDTGVSVVAVTAKYQGVMNCFSSILQSEGVFGFYKVRFRVLQPILLFIDYREWERWRFSI